MKVKLAWIGIALFSASWLFGMSFYHQADYLSWFILIFCGIPFLKNIKCVLPGKFEAWIALCMLIPSIFLVPWPFRMIPLLLFIGLLLHILPIPRPWPGKLSNMLVVSAILLLFQALALILYKNLTAFSHELPFPFPNLLALTAKLFNISSTLADSNLALFTMRKVHLLGTTWDFFLDPSTFCFLAGGIGLFFIMVVSSDSSQKSFKNLTRPILFFILGVSLWLPIRAGIHLALLMHRSLLIEYESPIVLMNQFRDGWLNLSLLGGVVFIVVMCVKLPPFLPSRENIKTRLLRKEIFFGLLFAFLGTFILTFGLFLDLSGSRKSSRVFVDEFHSDWKSTEKAFDTTWYGEESGHNYAAIYNYCSHFFTMNRLTKAINEKTLKDCGVLILKVPTSPYEPGEIEAVKRFVKNGGGLLLIGEHTDVFYTSSYLNDITIKFGFEFRSDCLLGIDTPFEQLFKTPALAHPIVQYIPPLDFAVSCSIEPKTIFGKSIIAETGLRSLHADYHASNFYPQVEDYTNARYGAFIQLWVRRYGKGRVAAFTDSTIFSNFCAFEPGKSELMLGMIEWLNRKNLFIEPWILLIFISPALFLGMLFFAKDNKAFLVLLISAGLLGWVVSVYSIKFVHSLNMPPPQKIHSFVRVNIDRSVCDAPLSKSGFIKGTHQGFGIFEQWILRLGYFTKRIAITDTKNLEGDLLIFFHPNKYIKEGLREKIVKYVKKGGKILIIDSDINKKSSANSLLYPFGIKIDRYNIVEGILELPEKWSSPDPDISSVDVDIPSAYVIEGGNPIMTIDGKPVCVHLRYGKGSVTVVGFGSRFTDANMGVSADVIPDATLYNVYKLEFSILRSIIENTLSQF